MFDTKNWSPKRFSWTYAAGIALLILLLSFILLRLDLIKTINLRFVYIPLVFLGIMVFSRNLARHTDDRIRFRAAFVHCFRTGIYTCLLLLPIILIVLSIGLSQLGMVDRLGRFDEKEYQTGFLISMLIEVFASLLISSFVGAFIPRIIQKTPSRH